MNLINWILPIPPAVILFFATFIFVKNRKSSINVSYSIALYSVGFWALTHCLFNLNNVFYLDVQLLKCAYFVPTFIPLTFYIFVRAFCKDWPIGRIRIILMSLPIAIFYFLYFYTDFMIKDVVYIGGEKIFVYGRLNFLFDLYFFTMFFFSFSRLFSAYRVSEGRLKLQIKYITLGTFISVLLAGVGNLILPEFFNNFQFVKFGTMLSLPMFLFITYSIFAHNLMDIRIVVRKTAIYSILATVITAAYFILIYVMEGFFRGFVGYKSIPWTLSVIVVFTLIFQPLKNMVQDFVDTYFFKGSLLHEYEKAQDELKRSERLKAVGTLAAGMAHEIKNPLTGIKTFTEYLGSHYTDPSFIEKFQKIVGSEVTKINDIVQQLLDFSKPKPLKLEQSDIHILIDNTLSFLSNDFVKYNIKLTKNYDSTLPLLHIDPNQIKQVFLNLFLNSIDAMKTTGGTLTITTKLQDNNAYITIQDTGTGISKNDLEHVFDPFYSTKDHGTGLGMSIVYGIIKEHKGDITVSSEAGKGARFRVKLVIGK